MDWTIRLYQNARAAKRGEYGFGDILSVSDSERAFEAIRRWRGYEQTPLVELKKFDIDTDTSTTQTTTPTNRAEHDTDTATIEDKETAPKWTSTLSLFRQMIP